MGFNHAAVFDAVAGAVPDRECIVFGDLRLTFAQVQERANRLANLLLERGLTVHRPRSQLQGWESGQDHVGLYLHNGNEYLEGEIGAKKARATPFNVNYRYVEDELVHLIDDAAAGALVYHAAFAPTLARAVPRLHRPPLLVQVADVSGNGLLPGALDYEEALAGASPEPPETRPEPDDLYILYTGGTTGMPKGTLWTQAGIYDAALSRLATGVDGSSLASIAASVPAAAAVRMLPTPPFMHGAAEWAALGTMLGGSTVVIPRSVTRLDPADVWRTVERERVQVTVLVGDAFARPLADELERGGYDASTLTVLITGGAATSPGVKARLTALLPQALVIDAAGSSETGTHLTQVSMSGTAPVTGVFAPDPTTCVIDEGKVTVVEPGHDGIGWLARRGAIPLGYLGDEAKTRSTFPVVGGERMAVPGDRARWLADGLVELLGRESMTINTGGEKVFAEEVEQALVHHPAVDDAVVVGRPSDRWGQEIVAVVQLHPGAPVTDEELIGSTAETLASFKRPKAVVRVDRVQRSPAGKADYAWARRQAEEATRRPA
jgi:fatty-acyl-CoA synthase